MEPQIRYIYVIVRRDLSGSQVTVQAVHAAIESARKFIKSDDVHPHLVLCGVSSIIKLLNAEQYLKDIGVEYCVFCEPDIGNEPTAIATEPLSGDIRKKMSRFNCL